MMPAPATGSRLSAEERSQALEWLDESHREFFAALDGVSVTITNQSITLCKHNVHVP